MRRLFWFRCGAGLSAFILLAASCGAGSTDVGLGNQDDSATAGASGGTTGSTTQPPDADTTTTLDEENLTPEDRRALRLGACEQLGEQAENMRAPRECLDELGGSGPPSEPLELPEEILRLVEEQAAELAECNDELNAGRLSTRSTQGLADSVGRGVVVVLLECLTDAFVPRAGYERFVGAETLVDVGSQAEAVVRAWLDGPTPDEEAVGLRTPLRDSGYLLDRVVVDDGTATVSFTKELIGVTDSWGLPGWMARISGSLGENLGQFDEVVAVQVFVAGACGWLPGDGLDVPAPGEPCPPVWSAS